MSVFPEYGDYDGIGLAELIQTRQVSAGEVMEEAISRIETKNPAVNAVVHTLYDLARKDLNQLSPDGILSGVPFLLKDLISEVAGVPLTCGSRILKNFTPKVDSEIVKRYRRAGLIVLGKTNCPEFGLLPYTEPELHGPTRNPWNLNHSPGGSSGGSAAAVAAGMVPLASGGDGGGSIRIPASSCGLFGLKPTRGRTPTGPNHGEIWQGLVVEHVITRSVRDSAAVLDCIQGADVGAPYVIPSPELPYLQEIALPPRKLKIAYSTRSPIHSPVHPECEKAVLETVKLLLEMGHQVEEDRPDIDGKSLADSYLKLYMGEVAAEIRHLETMLGIRIKPSDLEPITWTLGLLGNTLSAGDFVLAGRFWNHVARVMGGFLTRYDLFLTPTTASPPPKIGELQPRPFEKTLLKIIHAFGSGKPLIWSGLTDKMALEGISRFPFTQIANFTGQPAMSVPLHWTDESLPVGVHFIAPFGDEATLFRLAAQIEKAKPWFDQTAFVQES